MGARCLDDRRDVLGNAVLLGCLGLCSGVFINFCITTLGFPDCVVANDWTSSLGDTESQTSQHSQESEIHQVVRIGSVVDLNLGLSSVPSHLTLYWHQTLYLCQLQFFCSFQNPTAAIHEINLQHL